MKCKLDTLPHKKVCSSLYKAVWACRIRWFMLSGIYLVFVFYEGRYPLATLGINNALAHRPGSSTFGPHRRTPGGASSSCGWTYHTHASVTEFRVRRRTDRQQVHGDRRRRAEWQHLYSSRRQYLGQEKWGLRKNGLGFARSVRNPFTI